MPLNPPAIPDIPFDEPLKKYIEPIKETIEIMTGIRKTSARKVDAVPTFQDLVDLGLITDDQVPR